MRYRKLDAAGDFSFGHSAADFLIDSAAAVAQLVKTRLLLARGEWFLDTQEGTPYGTEILGNNTAGLRDAAVRARILGTEDVTKITSYSSSFDSRSRAFRVTAAVDTTFGPATVSATL